MIDRPDAPQVSDMPESGEARDMRAGAAETAFAPSRSRWLQRLSSVLFIIFCFELGLFLLVYPWTDGWTNNYFAWLTANRLHSDWHDFWNNTYLRGGVSGLGLVNVWIAIGEAYRMFAKRHDQNR